MIKKQNGRKPNPQRYFVPSINAEVMVEYVSSNIYVAHYPEGAERVRATQIFQEKWVNKGGWTDGLKQWQRKGMS